LKDIQQEIDAVNLADLVSPSGKICPSDEIIGELPDNLKKFYSVLVEYDKKLNEKSAEIDPMRIRVRDDEESVTEVERDIVFEHLLSHKRKKIIDEIFTLSVKEVFPQIVEEKNIGICENWQVFIRPMCRHCALSKTELFFIQFD